MYACCNNHFELAEYLMKCDANTMLTDSRGRTASTMAKDTPIRRLLDPEHAAQDTTPRRGRLAITLPA